MGRYYRIQAASFGDTDLPLVVSARVSRQAEPLPAAGSDHRFATSVQLRPAGVAVELRLRATRVAEGLTVGDRAELRFTAMPADASSPMRQVTVAGAVVTAVEIGYAQNAPAVATLRFAAESADGLTDPAAAEDAP